MRIPQLWASQVPKVKMFSFNFLETKPINLNPISNSVIEVKWQLLWSASVCVAPFRIRIKDFQRWRCPIEERNGSGTWYKYLFRWILASGRLYVCTCSSNIESAIWIHWQKAFITFQKAHWPSSPSIATWKWPLFRFWTFPRRRVSFLPCHLPQKLRTNPTEMSSLWVTNVKSEM